MKFYLDAVCFINLLKSLERKSFDTVNWVREKIKYILGHTVLSVATRNVPGIEIPAPPPIVIPFRRATYVFIYV